MNYIRWGRTTCPDTSGTDLVYSGMLAGSLYSQVGGGSNHLCLPSNPEFLDVNDGVQLNRGYIYGAEYQTTGTAFDSLTNENLPCAVCSTEREQKLMIPGKVSCPSSWTEEYYGYLMTSLSTHNRNSFECVDVDAQGIPGLEGNANGALLFFTEARQCEGTVDCLPQYPEGNELACVVCTK